MKRLALILLLFSQFAAYSQNQELHFRFYEPNKNLINTEITQIISIDKIVSDTVYAYANKSEFEKFSKIGYSIEMLTSPSQQLSKVINMATDISQMANWDRYPTYEVYRAMMKKYEQDYPTLCKLDSIGSSVEGRKIYVVKISDNVTNNEPEPEVFFTSTIHGDEVTGYVLMLHLIDYLLSQYDINPRIKSLINNTAIYINPNSNPDGTYNTSNSTVSGATRYNANSVDLNRNFPDPRAGDHPDGKAWQAETQTMMDFASQRNFILSANFHGGSELANFPWDTWVSTQNPHADYDWFYTICREYADLVHENSPSGYFTDMDNGVTPGGDWYVITGGRQDYMTYWHNCREVTFEISSTKLLSSDLLPNYWNYNRESFLAYLELANKGFMGTVTNSLGEPLDATITVLNHDKDNSQVVTNSSFGNYYRMIEPGTYDVTFSATGYTDYTINNLTIASNESKIVNVVMGGSLSSQSLTGTILDNDSGQPIDGATVLVTDNNTTHETTSATNGTFSINSVSNGIVKVNISANGYFSTQYFQNLTSTSSSFNFKLIAKQTVTGYIYNSNTQEPLQGVTVTSINEGNIATSDVNGYFQITDLTSGTNKLNFKKTGFIGKTIDISIPVSQPLSINLTPSTAESFETAIPEGIAFSGGNWTRDNSTAYDGTYSMRSATIGDGQKSSMLLSLNFATEGDVSFALKVSSEATFDFLNFYIDGTLMGSWSGEQDWTEVTYSVTEGSHTLKWEYSKDSNTSSGSDCAWVDAIMLPLNLQNVTFNVTINGSKQENASILFDGNQMATDADGNAVFSSVQRGNNLAYTLSFDNTKLEEGLVNVYWSDVTKNINLTCYYNISFEVKENNGNAVSAATVNFNQTQAQTTEQGIASFTSVPLGANLAYTVTMDGFENAEGSIVVSRDSVYSVTLFPTGITNPTLAIQSVSILPNPFAQKATINLELNELSNIDITVFDITGHEVAKLFNGKMPAGNNTIEWTPNANNSAQNIYLIRFICNSSVITKKIIRIR